jgi:hypothetical protein
MYRWLKQVPARLAIYPNVAYTSLGLRHEHLFITNPTTDWEALPYAIDAAWAARTPGERTLYLHCLVPAEHEASFRQTLEALAGACTSMQRITTGDAWQHLAALTDALDEQGRPTGNNQHGGGPPPAALPTMLGTEHPLLVPIATTFHGRRHSNHTAWHALYARLGERVWDYLPRRTRRWRHNGKTYVTRGLKLLHTYGLVRQHIIRYDALYTHMQEVLLLFPPAALEHVRAAAPVMETYAGNDMVLARALGDTALLKTIFRSDAIQSCWFIDERTRPACEFHYDLLCPGRCP